ncbi:MAG: hypothetical protein ACHQ4G_06445 [Opitutales bacterium]
MKLIWHIVKKDFARYRWAIALWAACVGYLLVTPARLQVGISSVKDWVQLSSWLVVAALAVGVIAGVVQDDDPTRGDVGWRTRPISPLRLLGAKLGLIGTIFIVVPLAGIALRNEWVRPMIYVRWQEFVLIALIVSAVALSLTAVAACTRTVGHCLALWVVLAFVNLNLQTLFIRGLMALGGHLVNRVLMSQAWSALVFSSAISLALVLSQFLRRSRMVAVGLLVASAVCSSMIGATWAYYYFYSG